MKRVLGCVFLAGLLSITGAQAAEDDGGWKWTLAPYGWLPAMDGDVTIRGLDAEVDIGLDDAFNSLDELQGALMLHLEAAKGKWAILGDITYLDIENDVGAHGTINVDNSLADVAVLYGCMEGEGWAFQGLVGARSAYLEADLGIPGVADVEDDQSWVDPIVGGRIFGDLGEKTSYVLRADIGGFGVGSDFSWNLTGTLGYEIAKHIDLLAAYRAWDADYEDGDFAWDVTTHGPVLGVKFDL